MNRFIARTFYTFLWFQTTIFCSSFAEKPKWETVPRDLKATFGESVIFPCQLTGLDEDGPLPRWEHRSIDEKTRIISKGTFSFMPCCEIIGDFTKGEYSIHITAITSEEEGEWKCTHVLAEPQKRSAKLIVTEKPRWKSFPQNLIAAIGEDVTLPCKLTDLDEDGPLPRWEFRYGGETHIVSKGQVSFSPRCEVVGDFKSGEYNIKIRTVTSEEEGEWKCVHVLAEPKKRGASLTVTDSDRKELSGQMTVYPTLEGIFGVILTFILQLIQMLF
ncbi:signal-regulatory protein beta-2-like [Ptychodera flava]|uniref:signal-regulatory protein beta-2-like n=1 Tax=Ptychodera flava TaxID=63121 RepID=UPI003969EC3B